MRGTNIRMKFVILAPLLLLVFFQTTARSQSLEESFFFRLFSLIKDHRHDPIEIASRPMIERFSIPLFRPRRVLIDPAGNVFIADWSAGVVLKITPGGLTHSVAENLNEPAGLAMDHSGNLYVSQHAQGMPEAGSIVKITSTGERSTFAEGFTGPSGMTIDQTGNLFVANFHNNTVSRITVEGAVSTFAEEIPNPAALVFDHHGVLYAVSSTEGTVHQIDPNGNHSVLARGLDIPSDISMTPHGHLVVTNFGETKLSLVTGTGKVKTFAMVPQGTISVSFDRDGNFLLVGWDDHSLMKVTTNFSIPCPHCSRRISVRLGSPKSKKKYPNTPSPKSVKVL
jgi:DNA-binding beta-propeller fold protein YncE